MLFKHLNVNLKVKYIVLDWFRIIKLFINFENIKTVKFGLVLTLGLKIISGLKY